VLAEETYLDKRNQTTITARFTGTGTNLNETNATRVVTVETEPNRSTEPGTDDTATPQQGDASSTLSPEILDDVWGSTAVYALVLSAVFALSVVFGAHRIDVWPISRSDLGGLLEGTETPDSESAVPDATDGTNAPDGDPDSSSAVADTGTDSNRQEATGPLWPVEEALEDGEYDQAVMVAYRTVRRTLESGPRESRATHWEFYRQYDDSARPNTEELGHLTEAVERATFAPEVISEDGAQSALEAARSLLS
jgi:hypothetical protein